MNSSIPHFTTHSISLPWAEGTAISETGKRDRNEDNFLLEPWPDQSAILAVVADGMGGNQGGAEAAQLAVDVFRELLKQPLPEAMGDRYDLLLKQIYQADEAVHEKGGTSFQLLGMGATVVVAIITPTEIIHLYAGDSRLYHLRHGKVVYKTADHSIVRILIDIGKITPEQVATHPMRSVVNSCLGGKGDVGHLSIDPKWEGDPAPIRTWEAGDLILLCSDGLHGVMLDKDLEETVMPHAEDTQDLVQTLVQSALDLDSHDNITVLAIRHPGDRP
jgi:protein phosphatase